MKILLACEGQSEVYLLNSLIERGYLCFDCPILLEEPIKLRQLKDIAAIINSLPIDEDIVIYRIGDTLKDELDLSNFKLRLDHIKVYKACTKPELEVLVIINEGLYSEYQKQSKKIKPKTFVNQRIDNFSPDKYFKDNDMLDSIKEYRRIKKHKSGELYLIDLIENQK